MRRSRSRQGVAVFVLLTVVLATIPGVVAAETAIRPTVVVERGETLTEDLTAAAGTVVVRGTVDGDVTALAGDVVVSGEVTGDVTAVAGRIEVTGRVGGSVRAYGGVTTVEGAVADGVDAIGGALSLSGEVAGTVDAIGVLVTLEETAVVEGQLQTAAVRTRINGTVLGASEPAAGGSDTNASLRSPAPANVVLGLPAPALLGSSLVPVPMQAGGGFGVSFLDLYGFVVNLLLGVVLVGVFPRFSTRVASLVARDPVRTGGFGLLAAVVAPVVLLLLGISLFGLPLALAGGAVLVVLGWVGAVYGRFAVGVWLLETLPRVLVTLDIEREPVESRWVALLVGAVVVGLLTLLPFIGPVVDALVALLGVGALVRLVYEAYARSERAAPAEADTAGVSGDD